MARKYNSVGVKEWFSFLKTGRIVISILPEIDCSQLEVKDLNRLLDDTHRTMQNELDLISSKNK